MPVQVDTRKTGPLSVLRRSHPSKPAENRQTNTTSTSKPVEKCGRSKEWRTAYRRLSFILDPFRRRSKSADPRATENGAKDSVFVPVSKQSVTSESSIDEVVPHQIPASTSIGTKSTSFPQPNLIAVSGRTDSQTRTIYVTPVNITGSIFEQYRRARGAGPLGPLRQPNGHINQVTHNAQSLANSDRIQFTNRPASFHPVVPLRDESPVAVPRGESNQPSSHHNPYNYQNRYSSSDLPNSTYARTDQPPCSPYRSFRRGVVSTAESTVTTKSDCTNHVMYESLYDYPPSLAPFPCPTYRPESQGPGRAKPRASSLFPGRKRLPRPTSIDPFLMLVPGSRASKPPLCPDSLDTASTRVQAHSTDRSGISNSQTMHPDRANPSISVYGPGSFTTTASDSSVSVVISPVIQPIYPHGGRSLTGDGSSAVCQVTVCHSTPKLCATVAETSTGLQRRAKPSSISRPRSTLLPSSDSLTPVDRVRTAPSTTRLRPECSLFHTRGSVRTNDLPRPPSIGDPPSDLDWTICSNAASSSIRQRRSHDADQSNHNVDTCTTNPKTQFNRKLSSTIRVDHAGGSKADGTGERRVACPCESSSFLDAPVSQSKINQNGMESKRDSTTQPMFWHSIPVDSGKSYLLMNGNSISKNGYDTGLANRNSWSAQPNLNGLGSREPVPNTVGSDDANRSATERSSWSVGSANRPTSVVLIPNPVCLPPPVGSRANYRVRVTSASAVSGNPLTTKLECNDGTPFMNGSRRYRTPTVSRVRPPRPPTRTTSLVRGMERDSRDPSSTPPTESITPVHHTEETLSAIGMFQEPSKAASAHDLASTTGNNTMTASITSALTALSDTTGDPRDRLADNEVEQTVADQDSVWWLSLLPYKPSNLPTNLAERLRQRNSLVLARCSPNTRLSNSSLPTTLPHPLQPTPQAQAGRNQRLTSTILMPGGPIPPQSMMTQSLYEQRDTVDQNYTSDHLSPTDLTTPRGSRHDLHPTRPIRIRLPTRPSSLYVDKPDAHTILMPSLAHLSAVSSSSGEAGFGRTGSEWDQRVSVSQTNQSDASSGPATSPSPSGDSASVIHSSTDPLSMLTCGTIPSPDPIAFKTWSAEKTDSPLLGQYCRLLNLRTAQTTVTTDASATNSDLPTPSAETPLTPV